jgi:hypothetical protein
VLGEPIDRGSRAELRGHGVASGRSASVEGAIRHARGLRPVGQNVRDNSRIGADSMRIRRGRLFWGLFLIPLGAIPLLDRAGVVDISVVPNAWQWWPLILIAIGLAILLGRSRVGLVGTVVVALALGTLGGTALASGNLVIGSVTDCASSIDGSDASSTDLSGTFTGDASTVIDLDCGSVDVAVLPGADWRVDADYRGAAPEIEQSARSLTVRTPTSDSRRQEWTITLGADAIRELEFEINAAATAATLAGATLRSVTVDMNAGDLVLDGSDATIDRLEASVNAGRMRITLDGATSGELSANAGAIDLCVPADADVRLDVEDQLTFATNLSGRGLTQNGDTWTRSGSGPAIRLSVEGNAASFTLDPERGCS